MGATPELLALTSITEVVCKVSCVAWPAESDDFEVASVLTETKGSTVVEFFFCVQIFNLFVAF